MSKYDAIIIDAETTGGRDPEPIEVAWGRPFASGMLPTVECRRYRPHGEITCAAMAIHGIAEEDLDGAPSVDELELPDADYWIGHNIDYDWAVLGEPDVKRICTLGLARMLWPEWGSHALGACVLELKGPEAREVVRGAHSASADIVLTSFVLQAVIERTGAKTWSELWELSEQARVPRFMPFGKHKGLPIEEVPADYRDWLLRQDDVDPYLRMALESSR